MTDTGHRDNSTETNDEDTTDRSLNSWDWLTVMEGPEVSGREKIWFGRHDEPWEQIGDDGPIICAEPVEHIPLPRPMTRPEIEEWLEDRWGEKIIKSAENSIDSD